jgi:hypothetical protein
MKAASIQELKAELQETSPVILRQLCLHLAKFKKENKELLSYLLFQSHHESDYILQVNQLIAVEFLELPKPNIYLTKKSLRKILRIANKHIKYMGSKQGEAQVLLYFCQQLKVSGIAYHKYPVLNNIYLQQLKKLNKAIEGMHEDEQYDFIKAMELL